MSKFLKHVPGDALPTSTPKKHLGMRAQRGGPLGGPSAPLLAGLRAGAPAAAAGFLLSAGGRNFFQAFAFGYRDENLPRGAVD